MKNFIQGFLNLFRREEPTAESSETFVETTSQVIPLGTAVDLFTFTVPARCFMRLLGFGNTCGTLLSWGLVYWEVLVDGISACPGTVRIYDQLGFETGRQMFQNINVPGGHTLIVRATNPTAANCDMGMALEYVLFYTN
jgi:hypothetical protein